MKANQPHILVIDDSEEIRAPLTRYFRENGFRVSAAENAEEARKWLRRSFINLAILDIMMPGQSGLDLCRDLRRTSEIPIIFLSAKSEEIDRIVGLEVGADDYVTKPFSPRELLARVRALLKRSEANPFSKPSPHVSRYWFATWIYDSGRKELTDRNGIVTSLSTIEGRLLLAFLRNTQQILSRFDLIREIYGDADHQTEDRNIDTHVSRLRRKLGNNADDIEIIKTIWGEGYMMLVEVKNTP